MRSLLIIRTRVGSSASRGGRDPMADSWMDGLAYEVMGNPVWAYVALVATFVGTYAGYRVLV